MTVDPQWIRGPVDELAVAQGCYFDEEAGDYVVEFLEGFCRQSKGEWAGEPLHVMDWQWDFIKRLYGWKRADGRRRFKKAYLEVPKKNGKSTKLSGLGVYHLIADGEDAPECYLCAYDKQQASIVYDESERMVNASPDLSRILKAVSSKKTLVYPERNGKLVAQSADVPSKDGLNASLVIFDELHRQRTPAMWRIYRYAGASRRQPLIISITTAGHDRKSVCWDEHQHTEKVNAGLVQDISHLGVIYGATMDEDYNDPALWRRCNPSMGITIREDDFAEELKEAQAKPSELYEFLRLRLNIWTNVETRFISQEKWDACGRLDCNPAALVGQAFTAGLDLSSTQDLAAFVATFEDGDDVHVVCKFWLPEDRAEELEKKGDNTYTLWARQGFLTLTPGATIDYRFIINEIVEFCETHTCTKILADKWNATQTLTVLIEDYGLPVETFGQGFISMNAPVKELERLVIAGLLHHGNNPVLNFCIANAVAVKDPAGNLKLSKEKSSEKIDGAVGLVMSIAGRLDGGTEDGESVYESRGLLIL